MKVLLPVKRVVDSNVKVRVRNDGTGVDIANLEMSTGRLPLLRALVLSHARC